MMKDEDITKQQTVNQYAMIWNYNAHVEHQHNYYGEQKKDQEKNEVFIPCELHFFDQMEFGTEEKQPKLIAMLNEMTQKIDISNGRDWFCIYAAYRYYKKELAVKGEYTNFFADIEELVPDKLTKIDRNQQGDKRYASYTTLMGREAKYWYMDEGQLPPQNEITTWKDRFGGDKNRFAKYAKVMIAVIKRLREL